MDITNSESKKGESKAIAASIDIEPTTPATALPLARLESLE